MHRDVQVPEPTRSSFWRLAERRQAGGGWLRGRERSLRGPVVAIVLAATTVLAGCSFVSPVVASVDGSVVSKSWLDEMERAFEGSAALQSLVGIAPAVVPSDPRQAAVSPGASGPELRLQILNIRIRLEIVDSLLGRLGLDPAEWRAEYRRRIEDRLRAQGVGWDRRSEPALDLAAKWHGDLAMIQEALMPSQPDEAALRQAFETQPIFGARLCFSVIKVSKQEDAERVVARLQAGESFSQVASEVSEDPATKPRRGEVGCVTAVQAVERLQDPTPFWIAYDLPDNRARGPEQGVTGLWFVRRGEGSTGFDFESARPQLEAQYQQARGAVVERRLIDTALAADVRVVCPHGRWVPETLLVVPCEGARQPEAEVPGVTEGPPNPGP